MNETGCGVIITDACAICADTTVTCSALLTICLYTDAYHRQYIWYVGA